MVKGHSIDSSLQPSSQNDIKAFLKNILTSVLGAAVSISATALVIYLLGVNPITNLNTQNVLIGLTVAYLASSILLHNLGKYPGNRPVSYLLPAVAVNLLILIAVINLLRIDYSRTALIMGGAIVTCVIYIEFRIRQHAQSGVYAVVPFGFYQKLASLHPEKFQILEDARIDDKKYNGIIVDSNEQLPGKWQQLIASQLSYGTVIIDSVTAYEAITGKSPLDHYGELVTHDLLPSQLYLGIKRFTESLLILITAPATLFIVLFVAALVKLESKGPAFFVQRRVGRGGKEFNMYKIRSMRIDSEANGAKFAGENDPRITKIGKFIRKMRIDELPQFINILKGDMALIGPRPEQATFVKQFEKVIPLYNFRHIVRPGITGWAQVTHGYAADEDETREKLAHDFYYVKNLSLWLDIDIVFKTIKTMLTGFGAR